MKPNPDLKWLEDLKRRAAELHDQEELLVARIRDGFVRQAIVFIDVVGSTAFKVSHKDEPEKWILRVRQFSELLASAVRNSNGRVIKFIGDEVMAAFRNVNDAQNLVGRIGEIEANLYSATGVETRIKVAADYGLVYELKFDGHEAPDPQGTAVDRCARISKFGVPGEVLASTAFAEATPKLKWIKVGSVDLKGLGREVIFQLGKKTADIETRIEVLKKDYDAQKEELDELRTTAARLTEQNHQLQQQLLEAGERPDPNAIAEGQSESDKREQLNVAIRNLKRLIDGAPGMATTYARFVFLYFSGNGTETYNSYEGRTFDELIQSSIVVRADDSAYELNPDHKRNKAVISALDDVNDALQNLLKDDSQDNQDLFEWSLNDPEYWEKYIGYDVLR